MKKNMLLLEPLIDFIILASILMALLNLVRNVLLFKFRKMRRRFQKSDKRWGFNLTFQLMLQTVLILLFPMTSNVGQSLKVMNRSTNSYIFYQKNDFLIACQMFKIFPVLRSYITSSFFSSNRAYRVW